MVRSQSENDVLVVGGGVAGIAAAIAAGRNGAQTVLVENLDTLGGTATVGVNCSFQGIDLEGMGGICAEIVKELTEQQAAILQAYTPFSIEIFKDIVFEMLEAAGVQLLFRMFAHDVLMDEDRIEGVFFRHKGGQDLIKAKVTIDATGDADIVSAARGECEVGDPKYGRTQPVSMLFRMGNVDIDAVIEQVRKNPDQFYKEKLLFMLDTSINPPLVLAHGWFNWVREQKKKGLYLQRDSLNIINLPEPGMVLINATRTCDINALNPYQASQAIVDERKQIKSLVKSLKEAMPGFKDAFIVDSASLLGVRESRRIVGSYQLTVDDIKECRDFTDKIARNFFPVDYHGPVDNPSGFEWIVPEGYYSIPYRCLLPKRIDNLLVAGRCISVSPLALASVRSMPCCMATGQAAGTAAAKASKDKSKPRNLDVSSLQALLRNQGVHI
jgi:hypothetical protein